MKRIVRSHEMKACDGRMIRDIGVPSLVLMERAACETVRAILSRLKQPVSSLKVLAVCGSGNNGGDGYAAARILHIKGADCATLLAGNPEHLTEETRKERDICRKLGISELDRDAAFDEQHYDVVIDAVFGIGLCREVEGVYREVIRRINRCPGALIAAVDIPSGIHADTGAVMGEAVCADLTVTMQFMKPGLLLYPGCAYAGDVIDAEIGIEELRSDELLYLPEAADLKYDLPKRKPYGNKGTFGKLLVVAGSYNMCGAAYLSARAALTSGAGMVKVLTVEENRQIIQEMLPEAMLSTYTTAEEAIECLKADLLWCDAVVCGSGMGHTERTEEIVHFLLQHCHKPLVLDADGINALCGDTALLDAYGGRLILTPHMGEMSRLMGIPVPELKRDPLSHALSFAASHRLILVMKDARTVTAYPDGRAYLNVYGNSGMATAGSGDVLAGIVASLEVQNRTGERSADVHDAVLLHALAGDAAKETHGEACLTATDLIEGIKTIYKRISL